MVNTVDVDDDSVNVFFSGRRRDCGENDFSIGLLLRYGDLTGNRDQDVADGEELSKDDGPGLDASRLNHHGAETSSTVNFMQEIKPSIAIVSNGLDFGHPRRALIAGRILAIAPEPDEYATNLNPDTLTWQDNHDFVADLVMDSSDGVIEINVWRRT